MGARPLRGLVALAGWVALAAGACGRADGQAGSGDAATGSSDSVGVNGSSGGSSSVQAMGGLFGDATLGSSGDAGADDGAVTCADGGCTSCIRIASIGHAGIYGGNCAMSAGDTSALTQWLDTHSTATIDVYDQAKPTLTKEFLAPYNVILLQWLRDVSDAGKGGAFWQFSAAEVTALADWVTAGGGIISLSGYDSDGQEVTPLNTLLSFTNVRYTTAETHGAVCDSCWLGTCAVTNWTAGSPIAAHVTKIGIDNGRAISVGDGGAEVAIDCQLADGGVCAAHEPIGAGHVFAFTDEWVTYTSQWLGTSPCLQASCDGDTTADAYQVPQFWYNAIQYASSGATCFAIHDPAIVPR